MLDATWSSTMAFLFICNDKEKVLWFCLCNNRKKNQSEEKNRFKLFHARRQQKLGIGERSWERIFMPVDNPADDNSPTAIAQVMSASLTMKSVSSKLMNSFCSILFYCACYLRWCSITHSADDGTCSRRFEYWKFLLARPSVKMLQTSMKCIARRC